MAGSILFDFRQGNRSEYLALYVLSALGIAVYVQRTEDIGVDFYCSLANRKGRRMTFHSPFLVQVKSNHRKICYGGPDKKNNKWKKEQIEWLFAQELPFFIAVVDKKTLKLELYSTSNMWGAHYKDGYVGEVVFVLNQPKGKDEVFVPDNSVAVQDWPKGIGNGKRITVPLGYALVSISLNDVEDQNKLTKYRQILEEAIKMEQENITYRRLGVHFSKWPHRYNTNYSCKAFGMNLVANPVLGTNTERQLESIKPIIAALAYNYKSQKQPQELLKLKPIITLLKHDVVLDLLKKEIPELFDK